MAVTDLLDTMITAVTVCDRVIRLPSRCWKKPIGDSAYQRDYQAQRLEASRLRPEPPETDQCREIMRCNQAERDFWHCWKIEEYCRLIRTDDEIEVSRKEAATRHYDSTRHRQYFGELQVQVPTLFCLPRELMDIIISFLDPLSEYILRLSCRELYVGCGTYPMNHLKLHAKSDQRQASCVTWRYISEWLPGYHYIPSKMLYCCRCQAHHNRTSFHHEQITRLPARRICEGHRRPLCVSADVCIHFHHLVDTWSRQKSNIPIQFNHFTDEDFEEQLMAPLAEIIIDNSSLDHPQNPFIVSLPGQSNPYLHLWCTYQQGQYDNATTGWDHRHRLHYYLFGDSMPKFYLRYFWRFYAAHTKRDDQPLHFGTDASSSSFISFCPHLGSDDGALISAVHSYRAAGSAKMMNSMVKCTTCETELGISQAENDPYITIQVTRNLGNMHSPVDPQWVAHLSEISECD